MENTTTNTIDYPYYLNTEVNFRIRSKGANATKVGVFLAVIPRNTTLDTATVKSTEHDFSKFTDANKLRKRADVGVVLVIEDGQTKYFTPRIQQISF